VNCCVVDLFRQVVWDSWWLYRSGVLTVGGFCCGVDLLWGCPVEWGWPVEWG